MVEKIHFGRRDTHHWDVFDGYGRIFAIRGEPGDIFVRGEKRFREMKPITFRSVPMAMAWVCDLLATETIQ